MQGSNQALPILNQHIIRTYGMATPLARVFQWMYFTGIFKPALPSKESDEISPRISQVASREANAAVQEVLEERRQNPSASAVRSLAVSLKNPERV